MRIAAVVPAKSTSERIFNKNTLVLGGYPLFLYKLQTLLSIKEIDDVYLDTDSDEFIGLASHLPVKFIRRSSELATNATDGHELFLNEVQQIDADIIIQLLCTSPFVKRETICQAIHILTSQSEFDSVVLFQREKLYEWREGKPLYGNGRIPNSVDLPTIERESMSLYAMRRQEALLLKRRFGDHVARLYADPIESIDINNQADLELACTIADGTHMREAVRLKTLSQTYSSAMLSDILDDLGLRDCVTPSLKSNMPHASVFGRAKTMKLRPLSNGEDFRGIYDALDSYRFVCLGDIIVVENEVPELAYFGDLNARLAMRQGASAAIVGGATRDSTRVLRLGFPVFAEGFNAQDVRHRAVVESMNKPVKVKGLAIRPGELIFADNDAIVRIPLEREAEVLQLAEHAAQREDAIAVSITRGVKVDEIMISHGDF